MDTGSHCLYSQLCVCDETMCPGRLCGENPVQALAPAFQREIRSMVIRHLPPQANGEGVYFTSMPACSDENQEGTSGSTCQPSPQLPCEKWLSDSAAKAVDLRIWVFFRKISPHLFEWFIMQNHIQAIWENGTAWVGETERTGDVWFRLQETSMELEITEI